MDITFQIMANPPTHDLSYDIEKQARRYVKGDIIHVYLRSDCPEPPSPNSRMVFVHITDVPITAIQKAKSFMRGHVDQDLKTLKRRIWNISDSDLPASVITTLRDDRQITVTWTQAKNYIKNKATENYALDGDLNG